MKRSLLLVLVLTGFLNGMSGQDRIIIPEEISYYSFTPEPARKSWPDTSTVKNIQEGKLRFGLNYGVGYLTVSRDAAKKAIIPMGITDLDAGSYYKDLKSGIYCAADATWMLTQRLGTGVRYKFFHTAASARGNFFQDGGSIIVFSDYSENIFINYAAASFLYKEPLGMEDRFSIYLSLSLGMTFYLDMLEFFPENKLITGNARGTDVNIGMEYRISRFISVAAEASVFNSTLREIKITDGQNEELVELEKEYYQNISRVDLSLGFRLYFGQK
jgi:hypothetical protein